MNYELWNDFAIGLLVQNHVNKKSTKINHLVKGALGVAPPQCKLSSIRYPILVNFLPQLLPSSGCLQ